MGFIIIAAYPREEPALASRVLSSAWDAPGVAVALAKQLLHGRPYRDRSPGNHHPPEEGLLWGEGLLWAARQLPLAFLVCKHRSNLRSQVKRVFFCPFFLKKNSFFRKAAGLGYSSWCALAGCDAPAKCCLQGSCSSGISRIRASSFPALKCL